MKLAILCFIVVGITILLDSELHAQYSCANPVVISALPYSASNLMTSTAASYEASGACSDIFQEKDYILSYTPSIEERISLLATFNAFDEKAGIYVFTDCAQPPTQCVEFEENSNGSVDISFTAIAGQVYYIFIGTENTDNFDLSISKEIVEGIAINKSAPTQALDVGGAIRISDNVTTPYEGTLKWNNGMNEFQGYNGTIWETLKTRTLNDLTDATSTNNYLALGQGAGSGAGSDNLFLGTNAGNGNTGSQNTYLGSGAGSASTGSGNVFIGNNTGNGLLGNNTLIIDNPLNTHPPLIYGRFDGPRVHINRDHSIGTNEVFGITAFVSGSSYGGMFVETEGSTNAKPYYGFSVKEGGKQAWIEFDGFSQNVIVDNFVGNFEVRYNTARKPGGGSWLDNSDFRLKKNVQYMDKQAMLDKLLKMQGALYEWDDQVTGRIRKEGVQIGFIAQDLQKIWPEKVSADSDGYLMTAYGDYDPVIIEAIKALNEKIEDQEKTIQFLLQKMSDLEKVKDPSTTSINHHKTN